MRCNALNTFQATSFTTAVDLWSAGCVPNSGQPAPFTHFKFLALEALAKVFAELILGQPLFTGKDGIDQLVP